MTGTGSELEQVFRDEWPKLVGAAARILRDLDRAEEVVQDVLVTALDRWPFSGIPDRPGAWLMTAVRNRARNVVRDESRARARERSSVEATAAATEASIDPASDESIGDDRLRLVFVCCHPVLTGEAQVALTLRMVGGLTTGEIARAFLVPEPTIAQRIVRAKRTIANARVPFVVPEDAEMAERLPSVLDTLYLIFNEGYSPPVRGDVCEEAIRLGRLLAELMPGVSEVHGLLALMLLHGSRLATRTDEHGDIVLLEDQDRTQWDHARINEAIGRLSTIEPAGPFALQAAIAAEHARAPSWDATEWSVITRAYERLRGITESPVVALNHAVAVAMADGPAAGLALVDALATSGALADYHLLAATRADLLRRLGRFAEAGDEYHRALRLAGSEAERRYLAARLADVRVAQVRPSPS